MGTESFETMLTGGHPNSLGRTVEVVEVVLAHPEKLKDLYACYFSSDEIVRLRTSSALKRVAKEHPEWLVPFLDGLIRDVSQIDQASTKWTLATLFETLAPRMTSDQRAKAMGVLKENLASHDDWIVLKNTAQTLGEWAKKDTDLREWLVPHLERLSKDGRKTVSRTAVKLLNALSQV